VFVIEGNVDILAPVVFEPAEMVLVAINLDGDLALDHEINPLEVSEGDLRCDPVSS
jgi:hypothetical protein